MRCWGREVEIPSVILVMGRYWRIEKERFLLYGACEGNGNDVSENYIYSDEEFHFEVK